MRLLPLLIVGLSFLVARDLRAENLPDPWSECSPRQSIAALASLRAPLDARPDDQDLLGRAIMAYVNLALGGEVGLDGACGPWLDYARELAERRARARGGEPGSLAEAAPELWVRVLDGDAVGTMAALARWPEERANPLHRALTVRATRDVRPFRERAPSTEHERYAFLVAVAGAHLDDRLRDGGNPGFDPIIVQHLRMRAHHHYDLPAGVRAVYADVAWMLRSVEVDDATAIAHARALIAGCGGADPGDAGDRAALLGKATQAATRLRSPERRPQALAAAVAAVRSCLGGSRGVMDGSRHRLVGLGDVAAWNRDRLYLAGWVHVFFAHDQGALFRDFVAPLRAALPGSIIVARIAAGSGHHVPHEAIPAIGDALARECADPLGISPGLLAKPLLFLSQHDAGRAAALVPVLLAARAARGVEPRVCLPDLSEACRRSGVPDLVGPEVIAASRRDPWSVGLRDDARRADPARSMLHGLPAPVATMVHDQVDFRALPFAGIPVQHDFALRWRGALRIETAGRYRLATESDDGSRLRLGTTVVDNEGMHAMQVRSATVELQPGWHPFELEFIQGHGGAGIRLLWQPPGSERLSPIPAAALAHGDDHRPGLRAELFRPEHGVGRVSGPHPEEVAEAEAMPWLPGVQTALAERLVESGRPGEAVAAYDRIAVIRPLDDEERSQRILALIDHHPPEVGRATALLWEQPGIDHWWWLRRLGHRLREAGLQEAVLAAMPAGRDMSAAMATHVLARIALDCADFATASRAWTRMAECHDLEHNHTTLHSMLLEQAVIARIGATSSPDLRALIARLERDQAKPCFVITARWLAGELSWEAAAAEASTVEWGDELLYIRGLYRITVGEHEGARADLAQVAADHPDWSERPTCESLLRWYGRQTPETLAALPRAPRIPGDAGGSAPRDPAIKPAPGPVGSDF